MSFLAPTVLWGLLAASIPLIIHLFSLRKTKTVPFSTIRFIKELEHETIRKLKLRQILLLILRTLAIILIVLIFARPVKVGYFPPWAAGNKTTRIIVLIDNSASMSAEYEKKTLLDISKKNVLNILENMEGSVDLDIYQTTPVLRRFSGKLLSIQDISEAIGRIKKSYGDDNLWEVVNTILREDEFAKIKSTREVNQEFYIFSDFPSTVPEDWDIYSSPIETGTKEDISDWRFFLFQQPDIVDNISISSMEVTSQLRLPGQLVNVSTQVLNTGVNYREDVPIQLYFEDERVGQVVSDFEPGRTKDFLFQAFPKHSGFVHGVVELPLDNYDLDNQVFFQFAIPPQINCKLVGQDKEKVALLEFALSSINSDSVFVTIDKVTNQSPSVLHLDNTDVLILIDPAGFDRKVTDEISKYHSRGGGLIIFLGDNYNSITEQSFISEFALPEAVNKIELVNESFFEVTTIDLEHPLFSEIGLNNLAKEMPQVFTHLQVKADKNQKVLLALSNGDPLLLENTDTDKKTLIFSVIPDLRWTDLPMRGMFVPLLHRMLVYLVSNPEYERSYTVGETITIPLQRNILSSEIEMWNPSGRRTLIVPNYQREELVINDITEVGVYELMTGGKSFLSFVVNISETESPSERVSMRKLTDLFPNGRTRLVQWDDDPVAVVAEARRGTELWPPFIFITLLVLALESWVGRVRKEMLKYD